jgi:hypothetical protein
MFIVVLTGLNKEIIQSSLQIQSLIIGMSLCFIHIIRQKSQIKSIDTNSNCTIAIHAVTTQTTHSGTTNTDSDNTTLKLTRQELYRQHRTQCLTK